MRLSERRIARLERATRPLEALTARDLPVEVRRQALIELAAWQAAQVAAGADGLDAGDYRALTAQRLALPYEV
jgi:hypothetical protein